LGFSCSFHINSKGEHVTLYLLSQESSLFLIFYRINSTKSSIIVSLYQANKSESPYSWQFAICAQFTDYYLANLHY